MALNKRPVVDVKSFGNPLNLDDAKHPYRLVEDYVEFLIERWDGPRVVKIDREIAADVLSFRWTIRTGGGMEYVMNRRKVDGKLKYMYLHRLVKFTPRGYVTDHINHDTLDNRRKNLRNVTVAENNRNRRPKFDYWEESDALYDRQEVTPSGC